MGSISGSLVRISPFIEICLFFCLSSFFFFFQYQYMVNILLLNKIIVICKLGLFIIISINREISTDLEMSCFQKLVSSCNGLWNLLLCVCVYIDVCTYISVIYNIYVIYILQIKQKLI